MFNPFRSKEAKATIVGVLAMIAAVGVLYMIVYHIDILGMIVILTIAAGIFALVFVVARKAMLDYLNRQK